MTELQVRDKTVVMPETVDELRPAQYETWLRLAIAYSSGVLSMERLQVSWLSYLAGLKTDYTLYVSAIREQLESQAWKAGGFYHTTAMPDGTEKQSPCLQTCLQLLPEYEGWRGHGDMLEGLSWGAFTDCLDSLSLLHHGDADAEQLYRDIALRLYQAPSADAIPPTIVMVSAVNHLLGVWGAITGGTVGINGEDIDLRVIFQGGGSHGNDKTGWTGVTFEIATDGVFGTVQQVREASMWDVLLYLYKCKCDAKRQRL